MKYLIIAGIVLLFVFVGGFMGYHDGLLGGDIELLQERVLELEYDLYAQKNRNALIEKMLYGLVEYDPDSLPVFFDDLPDSLRQLIHDAGFVTMKIELNWE